MTSGDLRRAITRRLVNDLGWKPKGLIVLVNTNAKLHQQEISLRYEGKTTSMRITAVDMGKDAVLQALPTYLDYTMALVSEAAKPVNQYGFWDSGVIND